MPKWAKLAGGWALAVGAALAMSWGAVSQVRNRVIQPSIEIPATVVAVEPTPAEPPSSATTTSTSVVAPEVETVPTRPAEEPATPGTTTTTAARAPASSLSTTRPTTTAAAAPTTTTTAPQAQTSSYQVTGGVVTIRHSPGVVTFVSAVPQPGYRAEPEETGPARVKVEFESEHHSSEFRAEWSGGELEITTHESG